MYGAPIGTGKGVGSVRSPKATISVNLIFQNFFNVSFQVQSGPSIIANIQCCDRQLSAQAGADVREVIISAFLCNKSAQLF